MKQEYEKIIDEIVKDGYGSKERLMKEYNELYEMVDKKCPRLSQEGKEMYAMVMLIGEVRRLEEIE